MLIVCANFCNINFHSCHQLRKYFYNKNFQITVYGRSQVYSRQLTGLALNIQVLQSFNAYHSPFTFTLHSTSAQTIDKYPSKHANRSLSRSFCRFCRCSNNCNRRLCQNGWCFAVHNSSYTCTMALAIENYTDNDPMHTCR